LTVLFAKRDRMKDAHAWLEKARAFDASCQLLARAAAEIETQRVRASA
jgi:hypothetical protein